MNWRFTRPGTVQFKKDEVFCFVMPVAHLALDTIQPEILYLDEAPELKQEYAAWSKSRTTFLKNLEAGDAQTVQQAWQRFYLQGATATGKRAPTTHRTKRSLSTGQRESSNPIDKRFHDGLGTRYGSFSVHAHFDEPGTLPPFKKLADRSRTE